MPKPNEYRPYLPVEDTRADIVAIKALSEGQADADQQKRALRWIVEKAGFAYEQSYFPGGDDGRRDTDFAEGRRFVANAIIKLIKMPLSKVDSNAEHS